LFCGLTLESAGFASGDILFASSGKKYEKKRRLPTEKDSRTSRFNHPSQTKAKTAASRVSAGCCQ